MEADTEMKDAATPSDADSLVSTAPSEQGSEYEVEEILAERVSKRTGKKKFLLKWAGYPMYRATWEPAEMFLQMEDAILRWDEKRRRVRAGTDRPFDLDGWKKALKDRERETQRRKEARQQKRAERAARKAAKPPRSNALPFSASRESSPDVPLIRANAIQGSNFDKSFQRSGSLAFDKSSLFVSADDPETKNHSNQNTLASSTPTTAQALPGTSSSGPARPDVGPPNSSLSIKAVPGASKSTIPQPSQGITVTSEQSQLAQSVYSQLLPEGSKAAPSEQNKLSDKEPSQATDRIPATGPEPTQQSQSQRPMASSSQTVKQLAWGPLFTAFASNKSKDREPDISQLNLRKPSEFPARAAAGVPVPFAKMTASDSIRRSSQSGIKATTTNTSSVSQATASSGVSRKESSEAMCPPSWAPRAPQTEKPGRPRPSSPRRSSLPFGDCYRPSNSRDSPPPRRPGPRGRSPESRRRSSRSRSRSRSPGRWSSARDQRQRSPVARRRSPDYYRQSNTPSPFVTVTRPRSKAPAPTTSSRSSPPRKSPPATITPPTTVSNAGHEPSSRVKDDDALTLSSKAPGLPRGPPMSAKDQIKRMPISKPSPNARLLPSGYFFNPGEVLAHVYFGKARHFVGVVRFCGLSPEVKKDLLAFKDATRRGSKFEMWFRDVTPEQYAALCQMEDAAGGTNRVVRTCWMEGFADTNPEIFHMSEFLRWENKVGIYFPPGNNGYVWLAYSPKSPEFEHLTLPFPEIDPWVPIRLAVRSPLPDALDSIALAQPMGPQQTQSSAMAMVPYDPSRTGVRDSLDDAVRRLAQTSGPSNLIGSMDAQGLYGSPIQSPIERSPDRPPVLGQEAQETQLVRQTAPCPATNAPVDPRLRRLSSMATVQQSHQGQSRSAGDTSGTSNNKHLQVASMGAPSDLMDTALDTTVPTSTALISTTQNASIQQLSDPNSMLGEYFERLQITFKELSCVNGKPDGPHADMFYLHTPEGEEGQNDCTLLKAWLELNGAMIWSDWAKFVKNSKCGVILFHESFGRYDALRPNLRDTLGSSSMGFWTFRISRPLDYPDVRYSQQGVYFQRIFSRGGAYLLTEDVLDSLKETIVIVYWFFSIQKNNPGQWKLVCWPNLMERLEEKVEDSNLQKDEQKLLFTLSWLIRRCNSIDSHQPVYQPDSLDPTNLDSANNNILSLTVAGYGERSAESNPKLPQDLTQTERNADHLAEAFAGWSIENAARLRRSYIISNCKNEVLLKRWGSWGHVMFFNARAFIEKYKINVNDTLERIHNKLNKPKKPSRQPQTGQIPDKAHMDLASPIQTPQTPSAARLSGIPTPSEPHTDPSNQPRPSEWRPPQPQGDHSYAAPYR
ncbi:uncharacterized protein N7496_001963 [Penicillium cataractarum]|uniref:Chromo domain-containing protein n=1 Tax=Penicillium cataractarum TaxID=2100454 RepID=A0A9W9VXA1_9EURO|nr:uncharacterized protein N7496_001963 [Penicillium cataractarum]KAJ5390895.1 hypothetical protein N7496_001963 [Penicillium cataractarum]